MITFQYFEGCPNADETLKNLKDILKAENINQELEIINIENPQDAAKYNFQGSPTILTNGMDIYPETVPSSYNYTCRVYTIDGIQTGILPRKYILNKLKKILYSST